MAWRGGPTGVEEQGMPAVGVPQEPGRPCRLRAVNRHEGQPVDTKPLACGGCARLPTGAKPRAPKRDRQAKATKGGGMGGRESERPTVPVKPGNRPAGTRWREGDAGLRTV